jgi:hypothetical protein
MKELAGRVAALDPDAGAALRVITYFDQLVERRAGLESMVRGAAALSGHPALLVDADRGLSVRVVPDGIRTDGTDPLPQWCSVTVTDGVTLWLEQPMPAGPVEAMVLERASMAARTTLDRTRSRTSRDRGRDEEQLEVLLDGTALEADRLRTARVLGIPDGARSRVVARSDGSLDLVWEHRAEAAGPLRIPEVAGRAGVGPAVQVLDLPSTVVQARTALRFTADGGPSDPGPRVVYVDELGGMLLLAGGVDADPRPAPDVLALDRAATTAPWMLITLDVVASHASLRGAAVVLHIHHSTLRERIAHAERHLGWSLRDVPGHLRLVAALMLRRLYRNTQTADTRRRI